MIPVAYRKIITLFVLIGIVFNLYDWVLHGLFLLFHALFSVVHVAFEWFEYALEHLIEQVFHTTRKQSQVIVFYLLLSMGVGLIYYFLRKLPDLYRQCETYWLTNLFLFKSCLFLYWQDLPPMKKIQLISTCTAGISCLVFLSF